MPAKRKARSRRDFAAILRRNAAADGWVARYRSAMQRQLAAQLSDVLQTFRHTIGQKSLLARYRSKWERGLRNAKRGLVLDMAVEGYNLGLEELGLRLEGKAAEPVQIAITNERLKERVLRADVEKYINETSKLETATSAARFGRYQEIAVATDMTWRDKAKAFRLKGLAANKTRAELMARTTTIWAYNNGAMQAYKAEGVGAVEWMATVDGATDPVCAATDGEQRPIGERFSSGVSQPPVHPNCRCAVVPVVTPEQVSET